VKAFVSLWSADLLSLDRAIDALDDHVEGFHLDIMDGHFVPELLFGPDTVRALAARHPVALVDVHLMVSDAEAWIDQFADAGAQMLTVHPQSCRDVPGTLQSIEERGVRAAIALTTDLPVTAALEHIEAVDRIVVMGTEIGIKGADISRSVYERVREIANARDASSRRPEIIVDGGIRQHTVPDLAGAGADGVVPGSLVFGRPDWLDGVEFIHAQHAALERS
jgi:ribulose-phosphate 3-epimerase